VHLQQDPSGVQQWELAEIRVQALQLVLHPDYCSSSRKQELRLRDVLSDLGTRHRLNHGEVPYTRLDQLHLRECVQPVSE
jgi:hypothetical protein